MKLSKNSFLKRISCIALSLMLCLTSFTLAGFTPTLEAEAATSKEVLHYTFDNGTRYDVNGQNQLSEMTWGSTSNGTDYYYNSDGGVYGAIQGLNGKNNWKLTYIGSSNQNLESAKQEGSCDFGLGTSVDNTDVIRVSSYGHIYSNETLLVQASVTSQQVTTIVFEYVIDQLVVTVNDVSYGPFTVESDLFQNVNSMYTGINSGKGIGSHLHYVYDIVATTVDDTCVTKADIDTAISTFENKINGTIYKNMKPAYDAYVNARKMRDAYFYGGDTSADIGTAYVLLTETMSAMTTWTAYTGNAYSSADGTYNKGILTGGDFMSNVLYTFGVGGNAPYREYALTKSSWALNQTINFNVQYGSAVFLWNGKDTEMAIPISCYSERTAGRYQDLGIGYMALTSDSANKGFTLHHNWHGGKMSSAGYNTSTSNSTSISKSTTSSKDVKNDAARYATTLVWKTDLGTNASTSVDVLSYDFKPSNFITDTKVVTLGLNNTSGSNGYPTFYAINYSKLDSKIQSKKVTSITNYKQGGYSSYLQLLDNATGYDPNSAFSGVGTDKTKISVAVNDCVSKLSTLESNLNGATSTTDGNESYYSTIRTELDTYKKEISSDNHKGYKFSDYTEETVNAFNTAYNNAVNHMATVDTEGYDKTTNNPKNLAEALTNARNGLTLKSFTIKFMYANRDTTNGDKYTIYTKGTSVKVPANSKVDYDDNYHYSYSWPTIEDVTADKTYEENKTPIAHKLSDTPVSNYQTGNYDENKRYTHSYNCSDCDYVNTTDCTFANQGVNGDTATVTCSVCGGTYTLDLEAYNKAVAEANTSINNTVAYTLNSRNALSSVLSEQDAALNLAKTQTAVDNCTETIISKNKLAKDGGVLVLEQYAITVKYFDATGNDLGVGEDGATYKTYPAVDYGTVRNIVAPTSYDGKKYSVYKWTRDSQGNNTISGLNSSSLDVVVKGASTYYVFLKRTSVDDKKVDNNAVITLNNKSGNIADIGYVAMNKDEPTKATVKVNTNAGTITIGNTTLTAPKYSFYNLSGFTINNVDASKLDTITLTKNMVIKPVYTPSHRVTIERANAEIRINGQDVNSYDADWNRKVVMTYNDTVPYGQVVIWKDGNGNILGQGKTYTFYANSNVKISTSFETTPIAEPTASIGLFSYDPTDNKVTVVNNFFVPDGMKVTKAGVILSTKNSKREALIAQTNGKFEGGTESFTSTGNQIRISVSRSAKTEFTMYALAYVVVEDENGEEKPYYAPTVRSITYTATKA